MENASLTTLDLPQSTIVHAPGFIPFEKRATLLQAIEKEASWRQEFIEIQGKKIPIPRLTAWHGDAGTTYGYSGIKNTPAPWFGALEDVRQIVNDIASVSFNSVLINLYRTGADSVAWHSDNEPELGVEPVIVSISLGASRKFSFKHKINKTLKADLLLSDGDVLIMRGETQKYWLHQVPKTTKPVGTRMNLTFRIVKVPSRGFA